MAEEDQEEEEGDVQVTCQHLFVGFTRVCVVEEDQQEEEEGGDVNLTCQHLFVGFTQVCVWRRKTSRRKRKVEMLILPVNTCLSALRRCVCGGGRPAGGRGRWRC